MFGSSLSPVVCRRMHVLFTSFVFVYVKCCPTHIVLCFFFIFLRLVYPMLPVSLCFSSSCVSYVASFSSSCVSYVASFSSSCVPYVASFSVCFFVLCILCCQFLCVFLCLVYPMLPVFLCLVYPMLTVSLDFTVLIAPSVISFGVR
jgi:hypothetical protein